MSLYKKVGFSAGFLAFAVFAGCGGGGGGGSAATGATTVTAAFVDAPTAGLKYTCYPSGLTGTTDTSGNFTCQTGDAVHFDLPTAGGPVSLGTINTPPVAGIASPVSMFVQGVAIAEVLQALNHGTATNMDVSGIGLSASAVFAANAYITSTGTNLSGIASDDQFLAWLQSQATLPAGAAFTVKVTGLAETFKSQVVLNIEKTIAAIAATNPAPYVFAGATLLSGSVSVSGSAVISPASCTQITVTQTGGGIAKWTVNGNIQTPGTYALYGSTPGYTRVTNYSAYSCTASNGTVTNYPASWVASTTPPMAAAASLVVASSATGGETLTVTDVYLSSFTPAGCTINLPSGSYTTASGPMASLTGSTTCSETFPGGSFNATRTSKYTLVGAW